MNNKRFDQELQALKDERISTILELKSYFEQRILGLHINEECEKIIRQKITEKMLELKKDEIELIHRINDEAIKSEYFIPENFINSIREAQNLFASFRSDYVNSILLNYEDFCLNENSRFTNNTLSENSILDSNFEFIGLASLLNPVYNDNCG
jgi:hypothetical protein